MTHEILILDDDIPVRDSLAICIEDEGFDVAQVASAEEALQYLEQHRAELVIVDLRLPGMDGQGFINTARERWKLLKFIVYTGSPEYRIPAEMLRDANLSDTIFLKPLSDFDPLINEIRRMLD